MFKKFVSILLLVAMLFGLGMPVFAAEDMVTIQILHTNDQHSRVLEGKYDGMGFTKVKAQMNLLKAENPNTLILDAGDSFHGQTIATLVEGESIVKFMNNMGYDVMTPGNHDFNYGQDRLKELESMANFDLISANIYKEDGTRLFTPYVIKEVAGIKVAIFGLGTPETLYKTHPDNVKGLTFKKPAEEAKEMVLELKDKADVIVCLAHVGLDEASVDRSDMIAEAAPEIDVIIDGHSHTELPEGKVVNGVLIASAKEYNKDLGIVELTIENKKITAKTARLFSKEDAETIEEDADLKALIEEVQSEQSKILDTVVSETPWILDGERGDVRTKETNLGSLVADAMLFVTGADASFTNGGGIRASVPVGKITKGDVITVLPFGNYIITKEMTGETLKKALEHGISDYPNAEGKFPHVGNICFSFNPNGEELNKVSNIMIGKEALDLNKVYTIATNDFLAAGGDGYDVLGEAPIKGEFPALDEALISYLNEYKFENQDNLLGRVKVLEAKDELTIKTYKVKLGDRLWKIGKTFGIQWEKIAEFNKLMNPNLIFEGQVLNIPVME